MCIYLHLAVPIIFTQLILIFFFSEWTQMVKSRDIFLGPNNSVGQKFKMCASTQKSKIIQQCYILEHCSQYGDLYEAKSSRREHTKSEQKRFTEWAKQSTLFLRDFRESITLLAFCSFLWPLRFLELTSKKTNSTPQAQRLNSYRFKRICMYVKK